MTNNEFLDKLAAVKEEAVYAHKRISDLHENILNVSESVSLNAINLDVYTKQNDTTNKEVKEMLERLSKMDRKLDALHERQDRRDEQTANIQDSLIKIQNRLYSEEIDTAKRDAVDQFKNKILNIFGALFVGTIFTILGWFFSTLTDTSSKLDKHIAQTAVAKKEDN